ncbi:hypothetical protein POM88_010152 [Heracleum sosnowskyi]|uniref:AAA ATPase AAA+ lid domain-containing protein n=1 Tax=Heracleum sosnowskyi TaxID=360622 RepID=A0AAD8JB98_9APIA|nr:hypothetical protein POM88_010152 [Heracleum sosnowskyi]
MKQRPSIVNWAPLLGFVRTTQNGSIKCPAQITSGLQQEEKPRLVIVPTCPNFVVVSKPPRPINVHARKKPMDVDVDYMAVASMTDGMVGAELANIIEVGAINMMREGRTEITTDDLLQAAQVEDRGMLDRKDRSPEIWKQVAINEAAMAVVAVNFPDLRNIEFFRNILGSHQVNSLLRKNFDVESLKFN